jgi:hypothetical protein
LNQRELRKRLAEITTGRSAEDWPDMIGALRREFSHAISELNLDIAQHFNCFAYALGLHNSPAYFTIASSTEEPNVFANTPFVAWLLQHRGLTPASRHVAGEKLAIYFDQQSPTHAGRVHGERVTSKWGTGKFFEHGIWEVPADYGDHIEFFLTPELQSIERSFLRFAEQQGVDLWELGMAGHSGG